MKLDNVIIMPKMTGLEYEMHKRKLDLENTLVQLQEEGSNRERIYNAHLRQKSNYELLVKTFPEAKVLGRNEITLEKTIGTDLVIPFGGDNSITYDSHFVLDTPMLPINSDRVLSEGALSSGTGEDIAEIRAKLEKDEFVIDSWPRLETSINGKVIKPWATSEVYIGKTKRRATSRYIITIGDREEEQKTSGFLITTGAGSTGWYDSEVRYIHPNGNIFPRTERYARFLSTAPYHGKLSGYSLLEGKLNEGESIRVHILKDGFEVAPDPQDDDLDVTFVGRGTLVEVKIAKQPLNVIRLINSQAK